MSGQRYSMGFVGMGAFLLLEKARIGGLCLPACQRSLAPAVSYLEKSVSPGLRFTTGEEFSRRAFLADFAILGLSISAISRSWVDVFGRVLDFLFGMASVGPRPDSLPIPPENRASLSPLTVRISLS
jgi:hypothetical protein